MIKYVKGDLLSAEVEALVNTVNTVGVMGKGIALQFKKMFPNNYVAYRAACKNGELVIGKMFVTEESTMCDSEKKIIVNFPTKKDWRHPSLISYIEDGLYDLARVITSRGIKSIAIPPLGCGNGGLDWHRVKPMIEKALESIDNDVEIFIYEPDDDVKEILKRQNTSLQSQANLTDAKAMLVYAMFYYESLGESVSLFVANKLAYFYQRLGAKDFDRLKFVAHHYGPYSTGVAHMINALDGKYLRGASQMTEKAFESLELQYDMLVKVRDYIKLLCPEKLQCVKNLVKLISGFQTAMALEALASVDFIRKNHPGISLDDTIKSVREWSPRKRELFKDEHLIIAYNRLESYQCYKL